MMENKIKSAVMVLFLAMSLGVSGAGTIELSQAMEEALRNNPDAVMARKRIAEAEAAVVQADALVWPRLSVQSSYQWSDNPVTVFGSALNQRAYSSSLDFNDVPDADNLNVGGVVRMPLYAGGRISADRDAARERQQATAHQLEAVQSALAYEVVRTYVAVQKTRAFIEAAEASVRSFEESVGIAQKRFDAGSALRTDVLDIQVRLSQAREDLVQARNANELARRALGHLMGREDSHGEAPVEVAAGVPVLAVPGDDERSERPELAALMREAAAADANVRSARAGFKPTLSAFAGAEHNRGWEFDGHGNSYTVGLMVDWQVWDGFLTRGKIDEAVARADVLDEQKRKIRLALDYEVHQARLNLESANERVATTAEAVQLAEESAELTRERFDQGLALTTQLIDAEAALTGARVRQTQARSDQLVAIAALRRALGLEQLPTQITP